MPCRYDPSPYEIEESARLRYKADLDRLTHENDVLREFILSLPKVTVPAAIYEAVNKNQVEHRKEDLKRLEDYFEEQITVISKRKPSSFNKDARREYFTLLQLVLAADPTEALEPQLGFDPDKY
jgi:hypothetical protein